MRANPPRRKFVENPRGTSEAGETENLAIQKRRKKRRGRNCPRKKVSTQCAAQGEYLSVAACRPQSAAQMPHALKRPNRMRRHIFSDNLLRRINRVSRQTKTQEGDARQCGNTHQCGNERQYVPRIRARAFWASSLPFFAALLISSTPFRTFFCTPIPL